MKAIVIFNHHAGTANRGGDDGATAESLRDAFAAAGMEVQMQGVSGNEIAAAFRDAVAQRPDAIIAGGGDGTINTAAAHLVGTGIPLGVLPLGTLNHFARDLGLPAKWRDTVPVLATASTRDVDVAEVNGRIFINNCSLGSYAQAVRHRDQLRREHGHGKWRAMVLASWAVFRELRRIRFHVKTPDAAFTVRSPFLVVVNNRYAGSVLDASLRPRLDEGRLWLYTTRARDHRAMLRLVFQTLIRPLHHAESLDSHPATEAVITVERLPLPIAADGELLEMKPPLQVRIRPAALRVLVPAPTPPE